MFDKNNYFVRIKTIAEIIKGAPEPPDEFTDPEHGIYQMFKKYGGKKLWVWNSVNSIFKYFYSDKILNDEELEAPISYRLFLESELIFLPNTHIKLDDNLFEL